MEAYVIIWIFLEVFFKKCGSNGITMVKAGR